MKRYEIQRTERQKQYWLQNNNIKDNLDYIKTVFGAFKFEFEKHYSVKSINEGDCISLVFHKDIYEKNYKFFIDDYLCGIKILSKNYQGISLGQKSEFHVLKNSEKVPLLFDSEDAWYDAVNFVMNPPKNNTL